MDDVSKNFYAILGVQRNCTDAEIRSAYRKLAMKWHPDKCSTGDPAAAELAKLRFQAIQEAYSVLSDCNKKFLYDSGLYKGDDDEDDDMGDFLGEMSYMMEQEKNSEDTFEDLRDLFMKIIDADQYIYNCGPSQKTNTDSSFSSCFEFDANFGTASFNMGCNGKSNYTCGRSEKYTKRRKANNGASSQNSVS